VSCVGAPSKEEGRRDDPLSRKGLMIEQQSSGGGAKSRVGRQATHSFVTTRAKQRSQANSI